MKRVQPISLMVALTNFRLARCRGQILKPFGDIAIFILLLPGKSTILKFGIWKAEDQQTSMLVFTLKKLTTHLNKQVRY